MELDELGLRKLASAFVKQKADEIKMMELDDDTDLFAEGVLDSFSIIEFVNVLEKEYVISIPEEDVHPDNLRSTRLVREYISRRLGK